MVPSPAVPSQRHITSTPLKPESFWDTPYQLLFRVIKQPLLFPITECKSSKPSPFHASLLFPEEAL